MAEKRNWHSLIGPNCMCECGVQPDGSYAKCGELLTADVASRELRLRAMAAKWRTDANANYRGSPSIVAHANSLANDLDALLDWENAVSHGREVKTCGSE